MDLLKYVARVAALIEYVNLASCIAVGYNGIADMALLSLCSPTSVKAQTQEKYWHPGRAEAKTDLTSVRSLPGVLEAYVPSPDDNSLAETVTNVASTLITLNGPGDFGLTCCLTPAANILVDFSGSTLVK